MPLVHFFLNQLAVSFPCDLVLCKDAANFHRAYPWLRLLYYGDTAILVIDGQSFVPFVSLWFQVDDVLTGLKQELIVSPDLQLGHLRIHELSVGFYSFCQLFFCDVKCGYYKTGDKYLSQVDHQKKYRSNGELKQTQRSFVCVDDNGASGMQIVFTFSGKYRQYVDDLSLLMLTIPQLLPHLSLTISSILTRVTNPATLKINMTIFWYLDPCFQEIFVNAHWFDGQFIRRRIRN